MGKEVSINVKIKEKVNEVFEEKGIEVKKIILFGSRARGDWDKYSDWDLLIIIDKNLSTEEKIIISHLLRRKLAEDFIPSDILIKSEMEVEERKGVVGSIIKIAMKEGIII